MLHTNDVEFATVYRMIYCIVSNQKEESISIQRVKVLGGMFVHYLDVIDSSGHSWC